MLYRKAFHTLTLSLVQIMNQRFVQANPCYARWEIQRVADRGAPNLSFAQFITCIIETKDPNALDPHYRPQYLMQGVCNTRYTHIGE